MYCPNCGTQNDDSARFCMKCGTQLITVVPLGTAEVRPSRVGRIAKWVVAIGGLMGLLLMLVLGGRWVYRRLAPTGGRIVFFRLDETKQGTRYSLWVTKPDGSDPIAIFQGAEEIDVPRELIYAYWIQVTPLSPDGKTLAFGKKEAGEEMVWYRADLTGENLVTLTNPGESATTRWSPDGRKILLQVERSRGYDLYIIDATGKNRVPVSTVGDWGWAAFSSDSRRLIVWDSDGDDGRGDLYTTDLSGTSRVDLASQVHSAWAEYSHRGNRLLLTIQEDSDSPTELFLADAHGENREMLGRADEVQASLSPDDKRIAVVTTRNQKQSLAIFDGEGKRLRDVVTDADSIGQVTFTPNSRRLAFSAQKDEEWTLNITDTDREELEQIYTGGSIAGSRFSPDSGRILFAVERTGGTAAYVSDLEGIEKKVLSQGADYICGLFFSPDGKKIVYGEQADDEATIFIAEADGTNRATLIEGGVCPAWSR